jgi:putative glutamine amidotransferase
MKPIIGIVAGVNDDLTLTLQRYYISSIEKAGGFPLIIPYTTDEHYITDLINISSGIMLTGGADICPETYNEEKKSYCENGCKTRDEYELYIFERALDSFKPILAICRGAQLVNVALGGTLYQDISSEYSNAISHRQDNGKFSYSHEVAILEDTPLFDMLKQERIKINSFHHQCIKDMGRLIEPMAFADDGIIEAFYMPSYCYLRAYQWHPERLYEMDENNLKIFEDFVNKCKNQGA